MGRKFRCRWVRVRPLLWHYLGGGNYFDPGLLTRDDKPITPLIDKEYQPAKFYYTDAITDNSIKFISEHKRDFAEKPFFLYVAYTAGHWPLHALEEDIASTKENMTPVMTRSAKLALRK